MIIDAGGMFSIGVIPAENNEFDGADGTDRRGNMGNPPISTECSNSSVRCRRFAVRRCHRDEDCSSQIFVATSLPNRLLASPRIGTPSFLLMKESMKSTSGDVDEANITMLIRFHDQDSCPTQQSPTLTHHQRPYLVLMGSRR